MSGDIVKAEALRIGDTVELTWFVGPWNTAIVKQIKEGEICLFRPYGTTADFTYTGGVICYIGLEEFSVMSDSSLTFRLMGRQKLR